VHTAGRATITNHMIQTAGLNALGPQSPVLMYKPQGIQLDEKASSLLAVDFVLGLQTVAQSQLLLQFRNGCSMATFTDICSRGL